MTAFCLRRCLLRMARGAWLGRNKEPGLLGGWNLCSVWSFMFHCHVVSLSSSGAYRIYDHLFLGSEKLTSGFLWLSPLSEKLTSRFLVAQSLGFGGMPPHVTLTDWESPQVRKGKNLENGEEVVTYQVPLPWAAKYGVISILRKFEAEFGCRLTVRGRSGEAKKKIKLGTENKIYFLHLKLVDGLGDNRSAETRRSCLSEAELHLDAFVRLVVRSPRDNVYMFPPEGQNEQPAPGASPARTFVVVEKVGPTCRFQ